MESPSEPKSDPILFTERIQAEKVRLEKSERKFLQVIVPHIGDDGVMSHGDVLLDGQHLAGVAALAWAWNPEYPVMLTMKFRGDVSEISGFLVPEEDWRLYQAWKRAQEL